MQSDTRDYLIKAQGKVIEHYRRFLNLPGVSPPEASLVRERILCHFVELELLRSPEAGGPKAA